MNWDAIGAVGELLGSLAVLVTLVYLSLQIRNARDELKHTIRQNNDAANREIILETVRNSRLTRALAKTVADPAENVVTKAFLEKYDLEFEEAIVLTNYYAARLRIVRETIIYDLDFFDDSAKRNFDRSTRHLFGSGPGLVFWQSVIARDDSDDKVSRYMKDLLAGT